MANMDNGFKDHSVEHLFKDDFSTTFLKTDHEHRPLWVCPNRHVYLETYSPIYKQAYDFLIAISDPVSRPSYVHEYVITKYSLYAAASLGLTTDDIIRGLTKMSKTEIDYHVLRFIRDNTEKCGQVKLLLKNKRYYVESLNPKILNILLSHPEIKAARYDNKPRPVVNAADNLLFAKRSVIATDDIQVEHDPKTGFIIERISMNDNLLLLPGTGKTTQDGKERVLNKIDQRAAMGIIKTEDDEDGEDDDDDDDGIFREINVYSFEVDPVEVEKVRTRSNDLGYPMLEEYDFRHDKSTQNMILPIELRPSAQIREYQEKALSKMFGNGRARSGIIVLPCGAGKTLVGITAMSTVRRSTLIFCTTGVAVEQWRRQIKLWTNLPDKYVSTFTRTAKSEFNTDAKVVITTYSMVAFEQQRSKAAQKIMETITTHEWGLVLLDEVHVAPADKFSKCVRATHSRCKLGLTATLVREDDKVEDLYFMLGPKLYEANWLDLSRLGFIATVQCIEVWCPMTQDFYQRYLKADHHLQQLLYVTNPNKFMALEMLVRLHEARGDKIMVFSDNVFALRLFGHKLRRFLIYGETSDQERIEVLKQFSQTNEVNTIFISKIGDNSIDLPDTNVIIQISSHFSSRRQEAQRLGRILRPKSHRSGRVDAHFYTLVSQDTKEMQYATKRQRFLVDQGYAYKVMQQCELEQAVKHHLHDKPLGFSTIEEQTELLNEVVSGRQEDQEEIVRADDVYGEVKLTARDSDDDADNSEDEDYQDLSTVTGGANRGYAEVTRKRGASGSANSNKKKK